MTDKLALALANYRTLKTNPLDKLTYEALLRDFLVLGEEVEIQEIKRIARQEHIRAYDSL